MRRPCIGEGEVSREGDGRGQANRPAPHVSMMETRNLRKKEKKKEGQSNSRESSRWTRNEDGGENSGASGGKRAEGEDDARQERSAATEKRTNVDAREEGAVKEIQEETTRGKTGRGGRGQCVARRRRREKKGRKKGKRLGRSLRTHPQPESTTLSAPQRRTYQLDQRGGGGRVQAGA